MAQGTRRYGLSRALAYSSILIETVSYTAVHRSHYVVLNMLIRPQYHEAGVLSLPSRQAAPFNDRRLALSVILGLLYMSIAVPTHLEELFRAGLEDAVPMRPRRHIPA